MAPARISALRRLGALTPSSPMTGAGGSRPIALQRRQIDRRNALNNVSRIGRDAKPVQRGRQDIERRRPIRHDDGAAAAEILE